MKISYAVSQGVTIEHDIQAQGPTAVKVAFKVLAHLSEVFGVKKCGNCGSLNVKPRFRTAKRKDSGAACEYYSYVCEDCKHEFKFGQKQEEGAPLFPKGWEPPYQGDGGGEQHAATQEPVYQYGPEGYTTPAPPMQQYQPRPAGASW